MLRQETSDHERYFVTAQRGIVAPYFWGNLIVFPCKLRHPRMEGSADSDMTEDSESKEDYTSSIIQYSYVVSLTSVLMKEQQNIQMLSYNGGHPF